MKKETKKKTSSDEGNGKKGNVTRKELAVAINKELDLSQRNSAELVDTIFASMKETLVGGESLKLVQFGTLTVRDKSPRRGRNPRTGESMMITKRKMVSFRPSKRLRELLNQ
ncbi:MAG: integration host factor subunit alpha [Candidatus Electrothrix sp. Rat3]|jgi:integration host factor subunit alpha|nr:integration host factor subunit alpha [Candidatus Electrothrix rattekaaiensis]